MQLHAISYNFMQGAPYSRGAEEAITSNLIVKKNNQNLPADTAQCLNIEIDCLWGDHDACGMS